MQECVCSTVGRLSNYFDETRTAELVSALNKHLEQLRTLLAQSKSLSRDVQYQIIPNNLRTSKVLSIQSIDFSPINRVHERFAGDPDSFWEHSEDPAHVELRRRLICVILFLRSKLESTAAVPPRIARLLQGQKSYTELKNAGRKYITIGRKLGGIGCLFWLPLDVPPSTEFCRHRSYMSNSATDPPTLCSCLNLSVSYNEFLSGENQLLLFLYALGGTDIPDLLLSSVEFPQRRWTADGEIEEITASGLNVPPELVNILSDRGRSNDLMDNPNVTHQLLDDGTVTCFVFPMLTSSDNNSSGGYGTQAHMLGLPPMLRRQYKLKSMWQVFEKMIGRYTVSPLLRSQVLEAILFFCERDSVMIRRVAVEQARSLLKKSMPYYLHASVVLFQSILYRIDGDLAKAEARIRDFMWRGPSVATRRDHALLGRLHISLIENKIKCYDSDVPSFIYKWEPKQPLSTLEIEVTSRLQTAASRFFQSVGDFGAARISLEQFLSLNTTKPIRSGTRHIIAGRLADMHCEMKEYSQAMHLVQAELNSVDDSERQRRSFRRLLLASAEANIGLNRLDVAEALLEELYSTVPPKLDDLHDQQLHMRHLLAEARVAHMRPDTEEAISRWKFALQEVERMHTLKSRRGFIAAIIYLSMAHAQLSIGDRDSGRHSWAMGVEILRSEICEFWIPVVPTIWLPWVVMEIHVLQGWSFRMALPGGKPDITYP
ncbi:unnamed protein product [Clonostachys solani]|uniref:Anaphase-promoting complex subunit 5 n=1 Tax=Clonostachys solani TaxID=160281 RepID=A0A9N9YYN8_9HYPO|nr:unnamed protein product [Clonostachys solani]